MDGLKARLSFDAVAYDYDDEYLTIDTDTHIININNVSRLFGVQYDGNSKLIKFRVRNQLSDIQKMQDSIVYINWIDSRGVKGQSIAINKTISNDTCEFAWKVPFDALKNSGVLHFAMSAVITENSSSVINQKWSTQIASVITPDGIYIKSYTPSSEEEDRIAQIYNELSKMINKQSDNLSNLQSQVNSLHKDLDDVRSYDYYSEINKNSEIVKYDGNYYAGVDGDKNGLANYLAYEFVAPSDFKIWIEHNENLSKIDPIIAIYNNGTWNMENFISPRYRNETLPNENSKLSVKKGQLFVYCVDISLGIYDLNFKVDGLVNGSYTLTNKVYLNTNQINQLQSLNKITLSVISNGYRVNMNDYDIDLLHMIDSSTRSNLWTIDGIYKNELDVCPKGTDIIGVLQEQGENNFMGGIHGNETCTLFKIIADGKEVTSETTCDKLDILMHSDLTRVSSGETIMKRMVHIIFNDNSIIIENTFINLIDSFNLRYAYNGGLFGWHDNDASLQLSNIGEIKTDNVDASKTIQQSNKLISTNAIVQSNLITTENLVGHESEKFLGEIYYYVETKRTKVYYSTDHNSVWENGHVCTGKAKYTLN